METYDDGRGFLSPLTKEKAEEYARVTGLNTVGYDEATDSYGPVYYDEDELIDTGIRFEYAKYQTLSGPIEKKYRRVATVEVVVPGEHVSVKLAGFFVNVGRSGEAYVHWPSSKFGQLSHVSMAFAGDRVSFAPLILLGFWQWVEENQGSAEVGRWLKEYTNAA